MKNTVTPPKLFLCFFRWYCHPKLLKYIEGDLMELYDERLNESGKRKADIKFIMDVLLLFRPGIIRPKENYQHVNQYAMFRSYFKVGWRNLLRNRGYSFINMGGLAMGITVAMLIGLWIHDELSFEKNTLAIAICCLGIFGLASFTAEQRTKEIGIRKVLGASVTNLWQMLSKDFLLLVIFSCFIAAPVSYYFLQQWLMKYEYRTEIGVWVFVAAASGALLITLVTVSYQAIKAAVANPIRSLRTE